jgi:IS5 family transposase
VHRYACRNCARRSTLCRAGRPSLVRRSDDDLLTWADKHLATGEAKRALARRMVVVEPIFAELKGPRGLGRASLRRTWRVQIQALLAATVHNLRQLAKAGPGREEAVASAQPLPPTSWRSVLAPLGV